MSDLLDFEIEALQILAGQRECAVWGAAMNAACEGLSEAGYLTKIPYSLTPKGRIFLEALNSKDQSHA